MKKAGEYYTTGQPVAEQDGEVLRYFFKDGRVKAEGKYVDGKMLGKWVFYKEAGFLWQVGYFDDDGRQHGEWTRYQKDGSIEKVKKFEHGTLVKT